MKRVKYSGPAWLKESLERDGYVVIPDVLGDETCDRLYSSFWDYLEGMNPALKRDDRSTWTRQNLPLTTKGLIQHYNVGFQRFTVDAHMLLKSLFVDLWGTDKLWTSFDGISFTTKGARPPYADLDDWEKKAWSAPVHVDQTIPGFLSVQGGLAVTTQREDQHVFLCIPGSHLHHEHLLRIGEEKPALHWEVMNPAQLGYLREKGLSMKRVPLQRGSVVMWDSRTVHSSAGYCKTAPSDSVRLQIFVCMRPVPEEGKETEIARRVKAYEEGRVSKHSADHIRLFGKVPRMYSVADKATHEKMRVPPSIPLTDEEQVLYGLRDYTL